MYMYVCTYVGDASKGKIISVYSEKDKHLPLTLEGSAIQQQSSNPQNNISTQLLEQQQQIINLLSSIVKIQGGQKFTPSQQQIIPPKVQLV